MSAPTGVFTSNGIDVAREVGGIGIGARLREFERLLDRPLRGLRDPGERVGREASGRDELGFETRDRVALAPRVDLLLRPIEVAIALRVAAQPVRLALDERRSGA